MVTSAPSLIVYIIGCWSTRTCVSVLKLTHFNTNHIQLRYFATYTICYCGLHLASVDRCMFVIDGDLTMLQLSVYRASSGVQAIMSSNARKFAEQDESMVVASGIPYTIVRTGVLTNDRGGKSGFSFEKGCTTNGSLSKEDAAFICIEALNVVPEKELVFEVVNGEEKILNWKDQFEKLMEQA